MVEQSTRNKIDQAISWSRWARRARENARIHHEGKRLLADYKEALLHIPEVTKADFTWSCDVSPKNTPANSERKRHPRRSIVWKMEYQKTNDGQESERLGLSRKIGKVQEEVYLIVDRYFQGRQALIDYTERYPKGSSIIRPAIDEAGRFLKEFRNAGKTSKQHTKN